MFDPPTYPKFEALPFIHSKVICGSLKYPSAVWERHIYILFLAKGVPYPPERTDSGACDIIAVVC